MEVTEAEVIRTDDVKVSAEYQFSKFNLSEKLQNGLRAMRFLKPSPIQLKVIPLSKSHLDMIIQSKSGTGKTLAYAICLLESYEEALRFPQALIVVPTREIAVQIADVLNNVGKSLKHFHSCEFIGGMEMTNDRKRIQNAKIVVGTPGRLLHLIKNEIFNTTNVKTVVLDEADKLFEGGQMSKDVTAILKYFSSERIQMIAVTATVTPHLETVMKKYMKNPIGITPKHEIPVLLGIKQFTLELQEESDNIKAMRNKIEELQKIFTRIPFKQCLLFTNSQAKTDTYGNYLKKVGYKNEVINGSQDQEKRLQVLKNLIKHKCRILITTDLMARGIDIENINLVINLDLPYDCFTYLHRIGRAGRFGTHGIAITFLNGMEDITKFKQLIGKIGRLQVLKFPDDKSTYNFWNFDDNEQELQLLKMSSIDENDNDNENEKDENVAENLMLLEVTKKLVDNVNPKNAISFDFDALLEDYEASKSETIKINGNSAAKKNGNFNGDIFSQAIKELNMYEEENDMTEEEKVEQVEELNNLEEISPIDKKENRHVIFKQSEDDSEDEILTDSSYESSDAEEECEEQAEYQEPINNSQYSSYQVYDQYAAQSYQQWRNIFDFQMANIQNYVKFQK